MVAYKENELVSATELVKKLGRFISRIKNNEIDKIGVLKNNRLEAVIISTEEYEFLKRLEQSFMENTKDMKHPADTQTHKKDKNSIEKEENNNRESEQPKIENLNRIRIIDELDVPTWHRIAKVQGSLRAKNETESEGSPQ
jgi:PHD/YefM family antitoxin component YafN of YafNO toxin-antitoxin module